MAKLATKTKAVKSSVKTSYDASSITWLKGLEGVRAKPTVYLGRSADKMGLRQCALEILGNCLDETTNGNGSTVGVKVERSSKQEDTLTFFDNGRGIPTGPHPEHKGMDTLTILATQMHAGGKLKEDDGNYDFSLGSHGMGLAVVNALSKNLHIWSIRNGKIMKQSFAKGVPVTKVVQVKSTDIPKLQGKHWLPKSGTVVQFVWDKTVFEQGTTLDVAHLVQTIRDMSWFAAFRDKKGIRHVTKFIIEDGKNVQEIERKNIFNYVTNALNLINKGSADKKHELVEDSKIELFGPQFDFVGAWSTFSNEKFDSAVNSLLTSGGKHLQGAKTAVFTAFKEVAKKGQNFREQDLFTGFIGCINVRLASPKFDGQGKNQLTSAQGQELTISEITPLMRKWVKKNKATVEKLIERACTIYNVTNDTALQKKLAAALATKKGGKSMLPENLIRSISNKPDEIELFTVEGKSAGGSSAKASDRKYQEVLPLRGKILNVERSSKEKMGDSQVIIDVLRSIGYDPKNPEGPLRVGKIMVLSDPDPDGPLHPSTLVPYIDDTGTQRVDTIEYLYQLSQAVQKEVRVLAMTPSGKIQQALAIDISIREYANTEYHITLSNGHVLKCTALHKWRTLNVAKKNKVITSNVNGMTYLASPDLSVGDQIQAQNRDGYLTVAAITTVAVDYQPYYCMTVPLFGNFLVQTTGSNGEITNVVSSNCHINSLVLTLLWKTLPYLFATGRIFLVRSPLFSYSTPKRKYYGSSLRDLTQQVGSKLDPANVSRFKGFGEMPAPILKDVAFNPETRELIQINHPDEYREEVAKIMGGDVTYRTEMLGV